MGSEIQNYRISRKIIVHELLVHILPADGAAVKFKSKVIKL